MSKFDIAAGLQHRIVLHGNVLDWVWDGSQPVALSEWVWRRLVDQKGICRVVRYNHQEEPTVLYWEDMPPDEARREFRTLSGGAPSDLADPATALKMLGLFLRLPGGPGAVIIENAEHALAYPSQEAVYMRQLTRDVMGDLIKHGMVIHLYSSESRIPQEFIRVDPDTAVILVSLPGFDERLSYFESLSPMANVFKAGVREGAVTARRLARATEGFRLQEIAQLAHMADSQPVGTRLTQLFSLFRFGKRTDYWANQEIGDIQKKLVDTVKGQEDAIRQVVNSLYRAKHRVGLMIDESTRTPAIVMFFVGATGVGKTLMARAISEAVTGSEENLKRIDMSEYQREHTDQRLIGPPPGYVGHLEGGQLTNWVLEHPHSVVLIDEMEKAHARILDIFLQILEGARLTDGKGVTVDMSETILIFTSNIGTIEGMGADLDKRDRKALDSYFRGKVEEFFRDHLKRPELFNRLKQGVIVFDYIEVEVAAGVIENRLAAIAQSVGERLAGRARIHFDVTRDDEKNVIQQIINRTEFETYGLRDVNNTLHQLVGTSIARFLDDNPSSGVWRFRWNETYERVDVIRDYDGK